MIDAIRYLVAYPRYLYYAKLRRKLKLFKLSSKDINSIAISHNLLGLGGQAVVRSNQLLRPLSVIDTVYNKLEDLDVLSIGPRTEGEILNLVGFGFSRKKIKALDLFSYSPWIEVGDMHSMPYVNNSFDVIISGWVIAYSDNKKKAAQEMIRVARPGAIIAIGVAYYPPGTKRIGASGKLHISPEKFIESVQDIIGLFGESVGTVYFQQDVINRNKPYAQNLIAIFSVK